MIIVFKLTIFHYHFVFLNRQIHLKRVLTQCKLQNKAKNRLKQSKTEERQKDFRF
jgi:hypothetical protein